MTPEITLFPRQSFLSLKRVRICQCLKGIRKLHRTGNLGASWLWQSDEYLTDCVLTRGTDCSLDLLPCKLLLKGKEWKPEYGFSFYLHKSNE